MDLHVGLNPMFQLYIFLFFLIRSKRGDTSQLLLLVTLSFLDFLL